MVIVLKLLNMPISTKSKIIVLTAIVFIIVSSIPDTRGLQSPQDIVLSEMDVTMFLGNDCSTSIMINSRVTNTGSTPLNQISIRLDVRSLTILDVDVDEAAVTAEAAPAERYTIIDLYPISPVNAGSTVDIELSLITDCLQEHVGLNEAGDMDTSHLIFYMRPLNEVRNLTFTAVLPPYAVLQNETAAPLFPKPTSNFTDGSSFVFRWETSILLPGQELAYIVKYQVPVTISPAALVQQDFTLVVLLAVLGGAIATIVIERIPKVLSLFRDKPQIVISGISKQEREILDFIRRKDGTCTQREIYRELNLSQSIVSTVLTTLEEERGLIKRTREGRENIIQLLEQS